MPQFLGISMADPAAAERPRNRDKVHDVQVNFRLSQNIVAAAELRARNEGMSLSELVRHALRRELRDAA